MLKPKRQMSTKERVKLKVTSSSDFVVMLQALTRPDAFPCALPGEEHISVIQTHASAVLLVANRAYKLKKPKNFGFFDYSTPELRRHFCGQEVLVNRRLAPDVYLGVAPVVEYGHEQFRFGPTFAPEETPLPGSRLHGGYVKDYAVVMARLPDEAMLESHVRHGTVTRSMMAKIAQCVAAFHAVTQTDEQIARFGELDVIRGNWEENFEQMRPFIGRTLDAAMYERIVGYVHRFMDERATLFAERARTGRIRDCHGDLRLQHIYIMAGVDEAAQRIAILDGIEFNERFRYGDVASEVAFLTMELDAACRTDLAQAFIEEYVAEAHDDMMRELLPFYACYRACVRGKVMSFQLNEAEAPEAQRELALRQAQLLFAQAQHYASGPTRPAVILVGGLMGAGKSTLALALHRELGWTLFTSDIMRKRLARLDPARPQAVAFGQGMYSQDWNERTYHALLQEADAALAAGRSVLLDATFLRRVDRQDAVHLAAARGANVFFVECECPREVALERLAQRWKLRIEGSQQLPEEAMRASDGRPDLYDAQCARWEPVSPMLEPGIEHLIISTAQPLVVSVEQVLHAVIRNLDMWDRAPHLTFGS